MRHGGCEVTAERRTWNQVGVGGAGPGLAAVPGALVPSGEQDVAVPDTKLGPAGVTVGPQGPAGPALCRGQGRIRVLNCGTESEFTTAD